MLIAAGVAESSRKPLGGPVPPDPAEVKAREREDAEQQSAAAAQLATLRASPRTPELGATMAEVRVLCVHQRGVFIDKEERAATGCKVAGVTIFACTLNDDNRVNRCDTYYEGGDLVSMRKRYEGDLGPPTSEDVSAEGFRIFTWESRTGTVSVTMYAKGVRVITARPQDQPP
jgi:hypothetical protein